MSYLDINSVLYEYFLRDEEGNIEGIKKALDGVSLSVREGDFISILGKNGSGKSTLAKLINALIVPQEGTVIVDGKDTKDSKNTLSIRMKTGMVFQNPDNQIVATPVEEDVAFGPENMGVESSEIIRRVEKSLKDLDMWEYRKKTPNRLSGGQKQRVAVAGIMAMEPKCIILDEATSMLDPEGQKDVISVAHRLNKEKGITIILITHNMEETIGSDYIYVMDTGKIIAEGIPREIFKNGEFIKNHGLTLPESAEIAGALREEGIPVSEGVLSQQGLILEIERIVNGNNS